MSSFTIVLFKLRQVCLRAIRSLMKSTSLLYTTWYMAGANSVVLETESSRAIERNKIRDFTRQVEALFLDTTSPENLANLSLAFQQEFKQSLATSAVNMLPSYNHQLPTGTECGRYLALDVGGSTLRVAVVELQGAASLEPPKVLKRQKFPIDGPIRQLKGRTFFEWIADRICETIDTEKSETEVLPMGMAWSFPIEQTSLRSGGLLPMGKGFLAAHGLLGHDLGNLIEEACQSRNLRVDLHAIVNDSSATLLSKAYDMPSTRFGLILGTGVNIAAHVPISLIGTSKFGFRPSSWHEVATHVIVNTEVSMFGKDFLPWTRWDHALLKSLPDPDFQPLEYVVGGHYLGEIIRRVLIEGIQTAGLFGGVIPPTLSEPFSLSTETVAMIQLTTMDEARNIFTAVHPTSMMLDSDVKALRFIARCVTTRAAAFIASTIHGLWQLRKEAEQVQATDLGETVIAYNGAVVESYPEFRNMCQLFLDALVEESGGSKGALKLTPANDSSLLGAAVAVACVASDGKQ